MILGLDGAGIVEEADEGSTVRAGDEVVIYPGQPCGTCEFCRKGEEVLCTRGRIFGEQVDGTFAGFVSAPEGSLLGKPRSLDFVQGASLSVAWLTAWRMIRTKARLEPGETALIFGVGGSVSLAATQIVSAMGARAIVTSRDPEKLERAATFGAAETIHDEGGSSVLDRVMELTAKRGVDVVIENVGKAVWPTAMKALVRGGRLVTCGATTGGDPSADLQRLFIRQLSRARLDPGHARRIRRHDRLHHRKGAHAAYRPDLPADRDPRGDGPARGRPPVRQDRARDQRGVTL